MPRATQHVLTISLEDDDQVDELTRTADPTKWKAFEAHLESRLGHTLDMLDRAGAKGTFFALGWTADHFPDVLRTISARGHELASRGYYPRAIADRTRDEFRSDLSAARAAIERATGLRVHGFRVAQDWLRPDQHWIFDVLAEEGYAYDSSLLPTGFRYRSDGGRRFAHAHQTGSRSIWEFPLSSDRVLGFDRPFTAEPQCRPELSRRAHRGIQQWIETCESPLVLVLHVGDFEPEEPGPEAVTSKSDQPAGELETLLKQHSFVGIGDYLKLTRSPAPEQAVVELASADAPPSVPSPTARTSATIIVPLFNQEGRAPALADMFDRLRISAGPSHEFRFLIIDDASTDATWDSLSRVFTGRPDVKFVRHDFRRGEAAAIYTGVLNAGTEVVCTIEPTGGCDPVELVKMIAKLTGGVAMVTGAPRRPDGQPEPAPGSFLYRLVLPAKLQTYTCGTRAFHKGLATQIVLSYPDDRGLAELLGRLSLSGGGVVEHPVTTDRPEPPYADRSAFGHLPLVARLAWIRLTNWARPPQPLEDRNVTIRNVIAAASKTDMRLPQPEVVPLRPVDPAPTATKTKTK